MDYYLESVENTLKALDTAESGLSRDEARKRLVEHGGNELAKGRKKSLLRRFAGQLTNPMVLILLAAAAVSLAITISHSVSGAAVGFSEYAEIAVILAVVVLNSVLGVVQESKAEKAIEALQKMGAATATARRGGGVFIIPAAELTIGDIVLVEAGDSIPADMRLIHSSSLRIGEAALTGESVPADKNAGELQNVNAGKVPLGDRANMAYMGSDVVYGRGEGVVTAVGMSTEMGKIAGIIQSAADNETPLQRNLSKLSKTLSFIVLGICAVIFTMSLAIGNDYSIEAILGSFMIAVALAVAAIPEGLAAVVTIVLSIGVTNMAKRRAIIRRLTAVEALGCAQVICSDKTGTLTQNKMAVTEFYGDTETLARAMALCCDSRLSPDGEIVGDPTENALVAFALKEGFDKNALEAEFPRVEEAPFDSVRKRMSTLHLTPEGIVQYTKGAPDQILQICSHAAVDGQTVALTPEIIYKINEQNKACAERALRVLACAYGEYDALPADCAPDKIEDGLTFIGLAAMTDPVRPEVKAAVESCKASGIKVVMITGDHKDTAAAIAKELGILQNAGQILTGLELDELSDEEFEKRVENLFVYARVQPENKVRIVNMWKKKGYVTAMTGDGVNDAPAIKSGDIGVGMGITGTDVTKNVADMVLADDNFATIVSAVEEGRRIYDNIRKAILFLLSTNLCEVLAIFIATILGAALAAYNNQPIILFLPIHLLFINLITDSLPAVALGMEHAEPDVMRRPPREKEDGFFAGGMGRSIIISGTLIGILTLASYFIVDLWHGGDRMYATTAAFATLAMGELFRAFTVRSLKGSVFTLKKQNKALWLAFSVSLVLVLLVIYVPPFASVFSLKALKPSELAIALALAAAIVPLVEGAKLVQRAVCRITVLENKGTE